MNPLKWLNNIFKKNTDYRIEHRIGRIRIGDKIQKIPVKVIYRKNKSGGEDVSVHVPKIGADGIIETKFE